MCRTLHCIEFGLLCLEAQSRFGHATTCCSFAVLARMRIWFVGFSGVVVNHERISHSSEFCHLAFVVTNSGSSFYLIDGSPSATLTLARGSTYDFEINTPGHPFNIKTLPTPGTGNQWWIGVTINGIDSGTITFTVPESAPDVLYYQCEYHSSMVGAIMITNGKHVALAMYKPCCC